MKRNMTRIIVLTIFFCINIITYSYGSEKTELNVLVTEKDKISYIVGQDIGRFLLRNKKFLAISDAGIEAFKQGIVDGMLDNKPLLTDQELKEILIKQKIIMDAERKKAMEKKQKDLMKNSKK